MQLALHNLHVTEVAAFAVPAVCAAFAPLVPWRSYLPLLLLPAIWLALAFWAGAFWAPHIIEPSLWVLIPVHAAYPLFGALTLYLVWRLVDLRVVTVAFAACNLTFLTRISFIAGMAVSGIWL
jgi:hypothetical protein